MLVISNASVANRFGPERSMGAVVVGRSVMSEMMGGRRVFVVDPYRAFHFSLRKRPKRQGKIEIWKQNLGGGAIARNGPRYCIEPGVRFVFGHREGVGGR